MESQSGGESQTGSIEHKPTDALPFYEFILGRELNDKEISQSYYLIEADVVQVNRRIDKFVRDNPGTSVKVLMLIAGNNIPDDLLIGCDPNNDLFVVSGYPGEARV